MKKINYLLILSLLLGAMFTSCEDDEDIKFILPEGAFWNYKNGVVIVEEGYTGGSISVFDEDSNMMKNNAYSTANGGALLGQYVQSFTQVENKGYIIENGSKKLTIVDLETLQQTSIIEDLSYPRYAAYNGDSIAYISNGDAQSDEDCIYVFDTKKEEITDTIATRIGPNSLELNGDQLFVLNYGGKNVDSFMTVINTKTNTIEKEIELTQGPADLVIDANDNIWVICNHWSQTTSTLFKINGTTLTVEKEFQLDAKINSYGSNLMAISPDKKTIYLEANGIIAIDYNATSLPSSHLISGTSAYGVSVNPESGKIWLMQNASTSIYSATGDSITSYTVGVAANEAVFLN